MFYCRTLSYATPDGFPWHRFFEVDGLAHQQSVPVPNTLADTQTICSTLGPTGTAIDAQILYSDGTGIFTSGIDWQVVYDTFGMSLLLFATGAGIGLLINVVRKTKV